MMINNSLKFLAEGLYKHGIASIRFDKRGIGKSSGAMISESELRFEHYVDDAAGWITLLKEDSRFSGVVVAGHSEGSLIGMLAARKAGAAGFISLAGSGRPLDEVIRIQLKNQPAFILDEALPILDQLSNGAMVDEVSPMLQPLFRKSVQPYLISQFRYNPAVEIANLEIPVMIIQGTTDIQIGVEDAEILYKAIPSATLKIVEGMNHILKESNKDMQQNLATYSNPNLHIFEGLNNAIARFVAELEM
jgi:pimeloyl-ACP methyl ester carboxylesterase